MPGPLVQGPAKRTLQLLALVRRHVRTGQRMNRLVVWLVDRMTRVNQEAENAEPVDDAPSDSDPDEDDEYEDVDLEFDSADESAEAPYEPA